MTTSEGEKGYTPAPAKPMSSDQELRLLDKRSIFLKRKRRIKCGCGGLVVGLLKGEVALPGHTHVEREDRIVGCCQHGIQPYNPVVVL